MTVAAVARTAILTPDRRLRVFVSSTLDLVEERAAVRRAVESLHLTPVMFEAGARPHPPRALYSAYVDQSDVFVAVYARRYGWTAPGMEVSGLEDEYDLSAGKPRLVYLADGGEREPALDAFLARVRDDGLSYRRFASAAELEELLTGDLAVLLTERFHASQGEAPSTPKPPPAPLPVPPTPLLGRRREVDDVAALLEDDDVRLVTLVGPGGIGKTRLAVEAARRLAPTFPGGTFFVPLATVREAALVADAVAAALDVAASDGYPAVAALADFLRDRRALLVLDNFEQVAAGAPTVTDLLAASPGLKVVVTSRAALRLRGEREVEVLPLPVPGPALDLFVTTARAVRPDFALDGHSAAAVEEICRQLDGVPLALELAAAMVRVLTPEMLLTRLRDRLTDLGRGRRDMPERHQTLAATMAWSYELLDGPARDLFAQLGVFRGGFTLERAEEVGRIEGDLLTALAGLVEQSLVRAEVRPEQGSRFTMLATVSRFAAERLDGSGDGDGVRARHARAFVALAEAVGRPGGRHRAALDAAEVELDNIRAAFEWHLGRGQPDPVATALGQSWWLWWTRGHVREGGLWADRCLEAPNLGPEARVRVLVAAAMFALWSGRYEVAGPAFLEAAEAGEAGGDRRSVAYARVGAGLVRALTTSMAEGRDLVEQGVTTFEDLGDEPGATTGVAALAWAQGITRQFDDTDETLVRALDRARTGGSDLEAGITEAALAQFRISRGRPDEARPLLAASLEHLASARHIGSTILTLEVIAELGIEAGASEGAVTLLGATAAIRAAMGTRVPPAAAARLEALAQAGRDRLGDDFVTAFGRGSTMTFPEAVEQGRAVLASGRP